MINSLYIENFKCLLKVNVELGPLTVLIGPNDSGKTSLLQVIELFREIPSLDVRIPPSMIWQRRMDRHVILKVNGSVSGPTDFSIELPIAPNSRAAVSQQVRDRTQFVQHLASSATYRLNPNSLRSNAHSANNPVLKSDGSNLAAVLHSMLSGPDRDSVIDLEKKLNEAVPTVRGISTPIAGGPGSHKIEFTLNVDMKPAVTIPSEQASDGAMLLLAFLVLVYGDAPDILLIEEPENGLHPSRLKMVIDILRKISTGEIGYKPRQVILTTHSPLLLNFVQPEEIRIFRRDEKGATQVTPMHKVPQFEKLRKEFAPGEVWYLFGEEELVKGQAT